MTKSASLTSLLLLLGVTCLVHVSAQPTPASDDQKAVARAFDEDIDYSELSGQPLIEYSDRQPRTGWRKQALRGLPRHKQANSKLYPKRKSIPLRHPGDVNRIFVYDTDPVEELPEPSTLPWMQLSTLGTVIAGLIVVFGQMLLDIKQKPNLPFPLGLNRYGRDLSRQSEFGNSSIDAFETTMSSAPKPSCTPQMVCETRQLITYVPSFERIIQAYGMSLNVLGADYKMALENGAARQSCRAEQPLCTPSFVTWLLEAAKAIERLWPIQNDSSPDFETDNEEQDLLEETIAEKGKIKQKAPVKNN